MSEALSSAIENKCQLLCKKVQDRKTQEIFEDERISYDEIADILEISEDQQSNGDGDSIVISLLATMKSIAHTVQSKARWEKFVGDRQDKGEEVFTFSSKGDFSQVSHVTDKLSSSKPSRHIVMCTHKTRMVNLLEIVKCIDDRNTEFKRKRLVRIYLDEFDKYISNYRALIEEMVELDCVIKITIVTATPAKIWINQPGWKRIFVLNPRVEKDGEAYLMFKDCNHFNTDDLVGDPPLLDWMVIDGSENIALIKHHQKITQKFPNIFEPGRVIFAPGNVSRYSHELVRQYWNHLGCSVAIVNGERTLDGFYGKLYTPNQQIVDIPHMRYCDFQSEEMKNYLRENPVGNTNAKAQLNDIIADLYHTYNLNASPFIITGRLCVERAQTLVHPVWGTFTDAIYFKASSPDDGYQQQRQLGLIKKWVSYRGLPRVFSPEQFRLDVLRLENRADNFASRLADRYATKQDYIDAGDGMMTSLEEKEKKASERQVVRESILASPHPFNTLIEVNQFLTKQMGKSIHLRPFHKIGGFELSTRLTSYYKKVKENLVPEDRLTKEKYDRITKSLNITNTDKGQKYMVYPVYPTMMSSPGEVQYYVHYLPNREPALISHA